MEDGQAPDEKTLRYLKALVTILTVTMILGLLTIVTLFVMRFGTLNRTALPEQISLPDGATAYAFTQGRDWFAVVTEDDHILIYNNAGNLRQRIQITP